MVKKKDHASSIVLGVNDALIEVTGTLTGLTFAFLNGPLIGITGIILGVAASLSMAASNFLSSEEENNGRNPKIEAMYTGIAYFLTVVFLVLPYFIFTNVIHSFLGMIVVAMLIMLFYSHYISNYRNGNFLKKFEEMFVIFVIVVFVTFAIGQLIKIYFGIPL